MSEKRFTTKGIIISHYGVWDTDDKPYANDDVVDLLNEQQATIQSLKEEIKKLNGRLYNCEKFRYQVFQRLNEINRD